MAYTADTHADIVESLHKARHAVEAELQESRARSLVVTKIDEAILWLSVCEEASAKRAEHMRMLNDIDAADEDD